MVERLEGLDAATGEAVVVWGTSIYIYFTLEKNEVWPRARCFSSWPSPTALHHPTHHSPMLSPHRTHRYPKVLGIDCACRIPCMPPPTMPLFWLHAGGWGTVRSPPLSARQLGVAVQGVDGPVLAGVGEVEVGETGAMLARRRAMGCSQGCWPAGAREPPTTPNSLPRCSLSRYGSNC